MYEHRYESVPTTEEDLPSPLPIISMASLAPPGFKFSRQPSPTGSFEASPGNAKRREIRRLMRLNTELVQATMIGNLDDVIRALSHGANVNATCKPARISCSHIASFFGYTDILRILLENGARPGARDAAGRMPLHLAAWEGNPDCVKMLLDQASDLVDIRTEKTLMKERIPHEWLDSWDHDHNSVGDALPRLEYGCSPLHVACSRTELICSQHLLAAGADLDMKDERGLRPLDVVAENLFENREEGDIEYRYPGLIKALIEAGAQHYLAEDYDLEKRKVTPLHTAIKLGSLEAISILLEANFPRTVWGLYGETPMHLCILKRLEEPLKLLVNTMNDEDPKHFLDSEDCQGLTPLQTAVRENWVPGVSIVLEAGADVTATSRDGSTTLHIAAENRNLEMMLEILSIPDAQNIIEVENIHGATALFSAINDGNPECVEALLNAGASVKHKMRGDISVFHQAAEHGDARILSALLSNDPSTTKEMINLIDSVEVSGMSPLHMAAFAGHTECVRILLDIGADIGAKTTETPHYASTALHLAATRNHYDIVEVLLEREASIVHVQDSHGWMPLHVACHHCHRESIKLLLEAGADLSTMTHDIERNERSAMDFLIYNIPRPIEFLESIFDSCIRMNERSINEPDCCVTIDYRILGPKGKKGEQMCVLNALLESGNQFGQKRLLIHPLVESFLYMKWRSLSYIFIAILFLYTTFVLATTHYITALYYYGDIGEDAPVWMDSDVSRSVLFCSLAPIALQELLHARQRSWSYFRELESWVKWASFILSLIAAFVEHTQINEWLRHVAAIAVLLAWTELMFLLSRFPQWGYYVLMFSRVAINIIKVLLTFGFLVIGFTFSFLIQFHSKPPFASPWQSFVKTMVMMTSEFDYSELFAEHEEHILTETIGRMVFVAFLILASIVLMNLMVGLAVNDINDLEIRGKTQRLFKQVNFLRSLDLLVYNETMLRLLPVKLRNAMEKGRFIDLELCLYPGRPLRRIFKTLPRIIKEALLQHAIANRKGEEPKMSDVIDRIDRLEQSIIQSLIDRESSEDEDSNIQSKKTVADVVKNNAKSSDKNSIDKIVEDLLQLREDLVNNWNREVTNRENVMKMLHELKAELKELKRTRRWGKDEDLVLQMY